MQCGALYRNPQGMNCEAPVFPVPGSQGRALHAGVVSWRGRRSAHGGGSGDSRWVAAGLAGRLLWGCKCTRRLECLGARGIAEAASPSSCGWGAYGEGRRPTASTSGAPGPCSPGLLASGELILQPVRRGDRFSLRPGVSLASLPAARATPVPGPGCLALLQGSLPFLPARGACFKPG